MKSPPKQIRDDEAREDIERFIVKNAVDEDEGGREGVTRGRLVRTSGSARRRSSSSPRSIALVAVAPRRASPTPTAASSSRWRALLTGGTALAGLALVDRGSARHLGWVAAALAPVELRRSRTAIWTFASRARRRRSSWAGRRSAARWRRSIVDAAPARSLARLVAPRHRRRRPRDGRGAVSIAAIWAEPDDTRRRSSSRSSGSSPALGYFLVPCSSASRRRRRQRGPRPRASSTASSSSRRARTTGSTCVLRRRALSPRR